MTAPPMIPSMNRIITIHDNIPREDILIGVLFGLGTVSEFARTLLIGIMILFEDNIPVFPVPVEYFTVKGSMIRESGFSA